MTLYVSAAVCKNLTKPGYFVSVAWCRSGDRAETQIIKGFRVKKDAELLVETLYIIGHDSWPKGESHEG